MLSRAARRFAFCSILFFTSSAHPAVESAPPEPLIATLTLNGVARGDNALLMTHDGDFWILRSDYEALKLRVKLETVRTFNGGEYISFNALAALAGNRVRFDEKTLGLEVNLPVDLFAEKTVSIQDATGGPQRLSPGNGAFANYYATLSQNAGAERPVALQLSTELGTYAGPAFVRQENSYTNDGNTSRFTRVATQIIFDHAPSMSRITALDTTGSSGQLGSTAAIGGISWASYYPMAPKLLRSPLAAITGTAETPSIVDISLGGLPIARQKVMPGAFEIRNIAYYGGARTLEITVTDASGRVRRFDMPYYFSDTSLREGLQDFNYAIGKLRRDTSSGVPRYEQIAFFGTHLYGLTDWLTLGARAEATTDVINGGTSFAIRSESLGLVSADAAASSDKIQSQRGHALQLAYSFQGVYGGVRASWRQFSPFYRTVSSPTDPATNALTSQIVQERRLSAFFNPTSALFLSSNWSQTRDISGANGQSMGLNLTYRFSSAINLTGGVRHDVSPGKSRVTEGFLGLFWTLNPLSSASLLTRHSARTNTTNASYDRVAPIGEGMGYRIDIEREQSENSRTLRFAPQVQFNTPWAVVRGDGTLENGTSGDSNHSVGLSIAGGITFIGNRFSPTRPIYDSFGLVELGAPIKDVRVYLNNQLMGKTNSEGRLYIPSLSSFQDNLVRLEHRDIPIEYAVDKVDIKVTPAFRAGISIPFNAYRARALSGRIASMESGKLVPLTPQRIAVTTANGRRIVTIEMGGDFYVEGIAPGNYRLNARSISGSCTVDLTVPESKEIYVELKETLRCE